ncbi:hypothetical protein BUE80_DR004844 [Diplocarpon rosae]|nr:hypothetical protein BUE80_DR004844 [Diplocarpon rosae]
MEEDEPVFETIDWKQQEEDDDQRIADVFAVFDHTQSGGQKLDLSKPLDMGVKAADALDYEDISDDDLPEEEEPSGNKFDDAPGLTDDAIGKDDLFGDDEDDLFGDNERASSPFRPEEQDEKPQILQIPQSEGVLTFPSLEPENSQRPEQAEVDLRELNFPTYIASQEADMPLGEEETRQYLAEEWPGYEKDSILDFTQLFPPKHAFYIPKAPIKLPKPVNPTKVSLNLAPDTEKSFRTAGPAQSDKYTRLAEAEAKGLVAIIDDSEEEGDSEDEFDYAPIPRQDKVGGLTLLDLEIICADFESHLDAEPPAPVEEQVDEAQDDWEREFLGPSQKRKAADPDFVFKPRFPMPNFDNFEKMTSQVAKRVVLDLNDPNLLVDIQQFNPDVKRRRLDSGKFKRGGNDVASTLRQRFNFSNDEAYALLKENHGKVRATVGNIAIEHSLPAQKLQWPYYRLKLDVAEARRYHRPSLKFGKFVDKTVHFTKPGLRKSKVMREVPVVEAYKTTKDLSLSDQYSTATLIEYSEEHPTVLSNFGMGNRIINYYRRKNAEDKEAPAKPADRVGDTTVLLPEDRSPFAIFGSVEPGETVRTIHNGMYRAPIFKHEPKSNDFLVVRSSTGVDGTSWYIRNIDNLFVAGQQLPSMEIPGPHARRVTNASKNRIRMIAFRQIRRNPKSEVSLGALTRHIADHTDLQARQKIKEFMAYNKPDKMWRLKDSEGPIPDQAGIRAMVKPEDVCSIDAMQVGSRHLLDAGYTVEKDDLDTYQEGAQGMAQKLAPWNTTKAFVEASAEKAMLELHGGGDPTGCGLGISMIKTSMKGGYLEGIQNGELSTAAARVALDRKANNGHHYNVKAQQNLYSDAISRIWNAQKSDLSDQTQKDEMDTDCPENASFAAAREARGTSPGSPGGFSTYSEGSGQKVLKITRTIRNAYNQEEEVEEIITDQKVITMYNKRKLEEKLADMDVYKLEQTGDSETDRLALARVKDELDRLEKNRLRRLHREKSKNAVKNGIIKSSSINVKGPRPAGDGLVSPSSTPTPSIEKPTGTTRKCANCGQAGHIKTNKKLCPMLNGSMSAPGNESFGAGGFGPDTSGFGPSVGGSFSASTPSFS